MTNGAISHHMLEDDVLVDAVRIAHAVFDENTVISQMKPIIAVLSTIVGLIMCK